MGVIWPFCSFRARGCRWYLVWCMRDAWPKDTRGPQKQLTDLDVCFIDFRGTNQPQTIFLERFSVRGVQKHDVENLFRENSHKIDKNFHVRFSSIFFVLLRFQVLQTNGSSKTPQKTFYQTIVSKSFYKTIDKKSKTDFFLDLFYHVFLGVSR
jgi:hypothetical protein